MILTSTFRSFVAALGLVLLAGMARALDVTFTLDQDNYNKLCGVTPDVRFLTAACIDFKWDIREHIKDSSPGMTMYLDRGLRSVAIPMQYNTLPWFTTLEHRIDFNPAVQNDKACAIYTYSNPDGSNPQPSPIYCEGDKHIQFP